MDRSRNKTCQGNTPVTGNIATSPKLCTSNCSWGSPISNKYYKSSVTVMPAIHLCCVLVWEASKTIWNDYWAMKCLYWMDVQKPIQNWQPQMRNDLCLCLSSPYLIKFMWLHYYFMRFCTFAVLVDDDTHGVDLGQVPVEQKHPGAIHNLRYCHL